MCLWWWINKINHYFEKKFLICLPWIKAKNLSHSYDILCWEIKIPGHDIQVVFMNLNVLINYSTNTPGEGCEDLRDYKVSETGIFKKQKIIFQMQKQIWKSTTE